MCSVLVRLMCLRFKTHTAIVEVEAIHSNALAVNFNKESSTTDP